MAAEKTPAENYLAGLTKRSGRAAPTVRSTLVGKVTEAPIGDLDSINVNRYPTLPVMRRAYELRANVTSYDAAYVPLAEVLGCQLLTSDSRLASALEPKCAFRVLI